MYGTKNILLVDDNPDDVALTIRAFRQSHIANRIVVAKDGLEALDYLFARGAYEGREKSDLPSVVLLDLKLPKIDGIGVLQKIRGDERTRLLPVVILTTSDEDRDKIDSFRFGANSYVRKPVAFEAFHKAARQLGIYWLLLNESAPSS
jgi:two-component system response regulator